MRKGNNHWEMYEIAGNGEKVGTRLLKVLLIVWSDFYSLSKYGNPTLSSAIDPKI